MKKDRRLSFIRKMAKKLENKYLLHELRSNKEEELFIAHTHTDEHYIKRYNEKKYLTVNSMR